jgi:hypothetical protein
VLLAVALAAGCGADGPAAAPDLTGAALSPLDPRAADADAPALVLARRAAKGRAPDAAESADARIGLNWSWDPPTLRVYQSTAVHLRLDTAPVGHEVASCSWNFGDGSPSEEGCNVSHTFHGGQADQVVTLTLHDGEWEWRSTRTIALERLEVVEGLVDADAEAGGMPPRPKPGPTSFRFALVADSAADGGVPASVKAAVASLKGTVQPELVVHVGGVVAKGGGDAAWDEARDSLATPLTQAGIKVAWSMGPVDAEEGSRVRRPELQILDGRLYPERYTFTYKGAFFLVFSSTDAEGVAEETLKWMREELAKARVYEARYVVSYLPLHKFSDAHVGSLDKKFRLYELFLRARVTALFTGAYRVYFKGRYGALPVVSVGALAGQGGALSGSDFRQPPSLVVVDQIKGVPERILAVEGPDYLRPLDEGLLPDTVEVYTR